MKALLRNSQHFTRFEVKDFPSILTRLSQDGGNERFAICQQERLIVHNTTRRFVADCIDVFCDNCA